MGDSVSEDGHAVHDLGGDPAGPIDRDAHSRTLFDQRVDAMLRLLAHPRTGHFTVDAMRRSIESLSPAEYHGLTYYERWLRAVRQLAVERGLVSEAQLQDRIAQLQQPQRTGS
ncbi:MAG: nitrile hydratase subunit beta [Proteobacteria bacterium]|nr:nitrile hydratase subunit beta [Burkholderiales bacterium]